MAPAWIVVVALLTAEPVFAAPKSGERSSYPEGVPTDHSHCDLRRVGEKPLWPALVRPNVFQQIRFCFSEGHSAYTKLIDFVEHSGGAAAIRLRTARYDAKTGLTVSSQKSRRLTLTEVSTLNQLSLLSGAWKYRTGSWDGPDDFFIHCETLDMERATPSTYSFSSVAISCNQPEKLMPFVTYLTGLVELKPYADRQMF